MWFAKLLRLRDKLTSKRRKTVFEDEKPFLDHLEDLRKTITKVVVTLLVCMLGAMAWYKEFLAVIKYPAQKAGLDIVADPNKPAHFDLPRWERVKTTARLLQGLSESDRKAFIETSRVADPDVTHEAEALLLYNASWHFAKTLNDKGEPIEPTPDAVAQRDSFLIKATEGKPALKKTVDELVSAKTRPDVEPSKPIIELVWRKPAESFFTAMKLSLYAGLLVGFPLVFYFILEFILPGLTHREKRVLWPALGVGFGLFLTGVCFAFFWVVPRTLQFFHEWGGDIAGTKDLWTFADYTSFVTVFSLVFGASFELPVVVLVLVKLGLLTSEFMRRTRSYAIIIIVIVAAIITPTGDPGTLAALAGPMVIMYEACIWIAYFMEKKAARLEAKEEEERRKNRIRLGLDTVPGTAAHGTSITTEEHDTSSDHDHDHHHHHDDYHRHDDDHDHHANDHSGGDLHPAIEPYDPHHGTEEDHDAWLKEQEEIYRREHAHLFTDQTEKPTDPSEEPDPSDQPDPSDSPDKPGPNPPP